MPLHRYWPQAREVRRSLPGWVDEDPAQGEGVFKVAKPLVITVDGVLYRSRHRVFWIEEVDTEGRALEPSGDRLGGFDLGEDEAIFVVNIHGGDELQRGRRGSRGNFPGLAVVLVEGVGEEGVGVGEEGAVATGEGGDEGLEGWVI